MTRLVLLLLLAGTPKPAADAPKKAAPAPTLTSLKAVKAMPAAPTGDGHMGTKCGACHGTAGWTEVRFNHDRTGFPLVGAHTTTSCRECHEKDFKAALPRACSGCHRDVHAGELGMRCDSCHAPENWRSRFDAEAHRRTNFPLLGGHAALPCTECHLESRERRFSRAAVDCGGCHQRDYLRTAGTPLDHARLGFDPLRCRECHGSFRFTPARFPTHDACFVITYGAHANIGCFSCHVSLGAAQPAGTCNTGTASCTSCHEHECSTAGGATHTDQLHAQVPGYSCQDRKCYECHQLGGGTTP